MLSLLITLSSPSFATDTIPVGPPLEAHLAKEGKGKGKGKKKGKGGERKGWEHSWWIAPTAGVDIVGTDSGSAAVASMGATAGIDYLYKDSSPPDWGGTSRTSFIYQIGSNDTTGTDVRAGTFFGPHWKHFDIEAGPDLFWNRLSVEGFTLEPTFGVDAPVTATYHHSGFNAHAGFAPTWVSNPDRRVDWSTVQVPGFGHEFAYFAGLGASLDGFVVSVDYLYRITAAGTQQGFTVSADVSKIITGGSGKK